MIEHGLENHIFDALKIIHHRKNVLVLRYVRHPRGKKLCKFVDGLKIQEIAPDIL